MELGMIGLGKMGAFMTERLVEAGHSVVGFDVDPAAVQRVVAAGASGFGVDRRSGRPARSAPSGVDHGSRR